MAQQKFIIRNRDNPAWLTEIRTDGNQKTYRYLPNLALAKVFGTKREAETMAELCRGRVQILKHRKAGVAYAEDIKDDDKH